MTDLGGRKAADAVCEMLAKAHDKSGMKFLAALLRSEDMRESVGKVIEHEVAKALVERFGKLEDKLNAIADEKFHRA